MPQLLPSLAPPPSAPGSESIKAANVPVFPSVARHKNALWPPVLAPECPRTLRKTSTLRCPGTPIKTRDCPGTLPKIPNCPRTPFKSPDIVILTITGHRSGPLTVQGHRLRPLTGQGHRLRPLTRAPRQHVRALTVHGHHTQEP